MRVKYTMNLKVEVYHEIDDFENLKGDREYAESVSQMICDEATQTGAVACVDILQSLIEVNQSA